jgi:hypothetical protein
MPNWRNWIARMTSNHEVAGSSPALGAFYRGGAEEACLAHNQKVG